ncbi:PfkB family carbohydrate kinase [Lichenihabitans sp. Uapishka_5]|uniref:carbohydrate kinase family protein n=1 Tax=Lichenihabitans sp. Uapishka_5 TaxID=3037302 RepID=UPI0029E7FFBE|nr:PfkB family carbohydrate kinase [Lichenihabitans sp. Uapishka_5]MDX7953772.1 PfkB family carbohydrate kinase [Lichenihabitans sp. Uapishka_5]
MDAVLLRRGLRRTVPHAGGHPRGVSGSQGLPGVGNDAAGAGTPRRAPKATTRALVALDPQEDYIAGNEGALRRLIAQVDLFMPSAEEVRRLLGHEDWAVAAATFAALGPETVVIKLGAEGCLVHHRGETFHEPATPAAVRDTTGAGDCFCGAFAASLVTDGSDLVQAARRGAQGASRAITNYGVAAMLRAAVAINGSG